MTETPASPEQKSPDASTPLWMLVARVLLIVAMAGAGYLAYVSFHNGPVAGCGGESGCSKVLQSRWAYWLDIPVSVPAVAVYLALFASTVLLQRSKSPDDQRGSWAAIITLCVILAGAALWFVGLQVFVIKSFCKFCMTAHACGFVAAVLCLKNIPHATEPDTPMWTSGSGKRGVPASAVGLLCVIGLVGLGGLIGGQLLLQKERNVVKVLDPGARSATNSALANANVPGPVEYSPMLALTPSPRLIAPRLLSLYSNQFQIKLDTVPMIGSPDATNVIVCLFDYTCPHCRALHPILAETQKRLGSQLGIVCLPMPISTNCDRFLPARIHSSPNACEYAQLGLAVWRAKPEVFHQFDDWMFAGDNPPPVDEARKYGAQLVGEEKLNKAFSDPWVNKQLDVDCQLHYANWNASDSPIMPQIIIGRSISSGPLNSSDHLQFLLSQHLGLPLPSGGGR
jgi:uncharacterized membrane protein